MNIYNNSLIIFVKNPELGKVKTRLAKTIGDEAALAVYRKLLSHTRDTVLTVTAKKHLFYDTAVIDNDDWSYKDFIKTTQVNGDLGERMEAAFSSVLSHSDKVVIIGSDCPQLSQALIEEAFEKLDFADVVIGPTLDGGYYLLGMKAALPTLFSDINWSSEEVLAQTISKIKEAGLLFTQLSKLSDIDYEEDLLKFPEFSA